MTYYVMLQPTYLLFFFIKYVVICLTKSYYEYHNIHYVFFLPRTQSQPFTIKLIYPLSNSILTVNLFLKKLQMPVISQNDKIIWTAFTIHHFLFAKAVQAGNLHAVQFFLSFCGKTRRSAWRSHPPTYGGVDLLFFWVNK